jgi:hypothetical protein
MVVAQPSIALSRDPTIISITISPEKPIPLSTITFTLEIEGENISEVYIRLKEANGNLCYPPRNVSMDKTNEEIYECNVTLEWADATYIVYQPLVYCNGIWYEFEFYNQILYPVLTISVPVEGHFHLVGIKLCKTYSGNTVLLGRTKVKVDVGYYDPGIEKVEFYLNKQLMKIDNENPYDWRWRSFSFGEYLIEIKAYVNETDYSCEEIQVIAFIL